MKKLIFLIMILLFSSFVYAGLDEDLAACNNDYRCIYRLAALHGDIAVCEHLDNESVYNCKNFVFQENEELVLDIAEEKRAQKVLENQELENLKDKEIKKESNNFPLSLGVISVLLFFFVLFLLFEKHRHESFLKDNKELVKYVQDNFNTGKLKSEIRKDLLKAGWKFHDLERVFKHLKK